MRYATTALLIASACLAAGPLAAEDILDLGSGAAVLEYSSEYSTDWKAEWSAIALIDGTTELGWCSAAGTPFPHRFVIELATTQRLRELKMWNSAEQEALYPGVSARHVEVRAALDRGFETPTGELQMELPRGGDAAQSFREPVAARYLEVTIRSNWGHDQFTELMELAATGEPVSPEATPTDPAPIAVSGVFRALGMTTALSAGGQHLSGCYRGGAPGVLEGRLHGRTAELEWRQVEDRGAGLRGSLSMVLADEGRQIQGVWYGSGRHAGLVGRWLGTRSEEPAAADDLDCTDRSDLGSTLDAAGRATLYGVRFGTDSAELSTGAESTLDSVHRLLAARPDLELVIEGHTDSTANDAHNLDLSRRRAEAVCAWLTARGVSKNRLRAEGLGESRPVADNRTSQGRRLNRRVEIRVDAGVEAQDARQAS